MGSLLNGASPCWRSPASTSLPCNAGCRWKTYAPSRSSLLSWPISRPHPGQPFFPREPVRFPGRRQSRVCLGIHALTGMLLLLSMAQSGRCSAGPLHVDDLAVVAAAIGALGLALDAAATLPFTQERSDEVGQLTASPGRCRRSWPDLLLDERTGRRPQRSPFAQDSCCTQGLICKADRIPPGFQPSHSLRSGQLFAMVLAIAVTQT